MSNITKKAASLQAILEKHNLLQKSATEIQHISSPENQGAEGKAQQSMIEEGCQGDYASGTESAIGNVPGDYVEGMDECSKAALSASGTSIQQIDTFGNAQGSPAQVAKTAALKQKLAACIDSAMNKQAAYQYAIEHEFISATEVMQKVAAMTQAQDSGMLNKIASDISVDFKRLHNANPLFGPACEYVAMRKMASEIEALAEAQGIPEEEAAAALDASMANDPAAQEEFNNEVEGQALTELADAEQQTEELMAGLDETAAKVSEITGEPISAEDIVAAVEDVAAQAEEMGVPPEVLIQQAAEEMLGGAEGMEQAVTPEDEAVAEQLLEEAAANGISPEELIQGLAGELEGGEAEAMPEEAVEEPVSEQEAAEEVQKTACLQKLASTRRGANLLRVLSGC